MSLDFSPGWCSHCQNTGSVECYCGGDLCICDNYGEEPCPFCGGESEFFCDDIEEGFDAGEWNNTPPTKPSA